MVYWSRAPGCSIHCRFPAAPANRLRTARRGHFLTRSSRAESTTSSASRHHLRHSPAGQRVVPITVGVGGRTYGTRSAMPRGGGPVGQHLHEDMIRARRYPSPQESSSTVARRPLSVVTCGCAPDLGRDADVLARERRASRVCLGGVPCRRPRIPRERSVRGRRPLRPRRAGDAIALRRAGAGVDRFVEPRFRAGSRLPKGRGRVRRGLSRPHRATLNRGRDELVASPRVPGYDLRVPVGGRPQVTRPRARCRTRTPTRSRS